MRSRYLPVSNRRRMPILPLSNQLAGRCSSAAAAVVPGDLDATQCACAKRGGRARAPPLSQRPYKANGLVWSDTSVQRHDRAGPKPTPSGRDTAGGRELRGSSTDRTPNHPGDVWAHGQQVQKPSRRFKALIRGGPLPADKDACARSGGAGACRSDQEREALGVQLAEDLSARRKQTEWGHAAAWPGLSRRSTGPPPPVLQQAVPCDRPRADALPPWPTGAQPNGGDLLSLRVACSRWQNIAANEHRRKASQHNMWMPNAKCHHTWQTTGADQKQTW